jgi:hypothetical protein
VHSSISNSDIHLAQRSLPTGRWFAPVIAGGMLLLLCIVGLEGALAARGFKATVMDSPALWSHERLRASEAGKKAIILVGASRAQLDTDLDVLARATGKLPVQLAIDGSSYLPVLADLAEDARVTGTILVDAQGGVPDPSYQDGATMYVSFWRSRQRAGGHVDFTSTESVLTDLRQATMRSYADATGPFASLLTRVLRPSATPQYLATLPSRSREADYTKVSMPGFYYTRVIRNAGIKNVPRLPDFQSLDKVLAERIRGLPQAPTRDLVENANLLGAIVRRIESRGGKVIFVMFPRSGLVRATDDVVFPRAVFWDRIIPLAGGKGLNFEDEPTLRTFICPDGSHLDVRDKRRFTEALVTALKERGWIGAGT